jgi:hypothetical protein
MPIGALVAGPLAAAIGVSVTQYGAAVLILAAAALALIPRDVRAMKASDVAAGVLPEPGSELAAGHSRS